MKKKTKGREGVLRLFLANLGKVLDHKQLRAASGNQTEWGRRLRDLRQLGWQILSHKDRADLKPGEYVMETDHRQPLLPRNISKETRACVLERNGYTCQMCGIGASDPDPYNPGRKIRLEMGHIIDKSKGGADDPSNLRAVCTNCNQGLQNAGPIKPDRLQLMTQIRRATVSDQLHVLEWLRKKFNL